MGLSYWQDTFLANQRCQLGMCLCYSVVPNIRGRLDGLRRIDGLGQVGTEGALSWRGVGHEQMGITVTSHDNCLTSFDMTFNANTSNSIYSDSISKPTVDALLGLNLIRAF